MNKNLDKQLAQVFENDYPGYECFVEKVINVIFTGDDAYEALTIPEEYLSDEKRQKAKESGILKILKVGEINTSEPIEVFDITLSDRKDLQYNRVGIQSFIRSELFMFTNAFMLFHNENPEGKDWRFSFAYKDTTIKGMTSAKRYTYLFGKNHRVRTASERFAKLADAEKDTQNLLNAFSVEALSKDFFNGYKEQYKAFCDFLFAHKDDREYFGPKFSQWEDKYLRDYVKKMMGRVTFIYFLQRKGWMNGNLNYMQNAFDNSTCKDDYLDSFLEPLFCGVLNTKPEERAELFKSLGWNLSLIDGWKDIPYLNGGLFERDEQDKPKSKFPVEMFEELFDFYSRYNFTIYENDPDDAEVGIDPEMLGHIFENLLEDNKDKGAFYTPKEIVQYMSRESIAQYLKTHADEALHTAIDDLIKNGKVGESLQDKANATAIYRLLCDVKVCDPAIGSGAFPMGVLNVLYHARMLLYAFTRPTQGFSPAMVKREIIQNNIYGVDIEKGAVDIARLRFWLALVVDEEEPQPLPNLDYKIMCGNSLIHRFALDAPFKDVLKHYNKENKTDITLDDYRQWVYDYTNLSDHTQKDNFRQKIEEIKHAFRTELSMKEIDKLSKVRGKIEDLQSKDIFGNQKGSATEIKKLQGRLKDLEAQRDDIYNNKLYENAFEWRFEFPALLDEGGNFTGFDVVIGNPPYVFARDSKGKGITAEKKKLYYNHFDLAKYQVNLYHLFIEQGTNVLTENGIFSYIVPNNWLTINTNKELRKFVLEKSNIQIINFYKKVFENADVDSSILLFKKVKCDNAIIELFEAIQKDKIELIKETNSSFFFAQKDFVINIELFKNNSYARVMTKIENESKELKDIADVKAGLCAYEVGAGTPPQTKEMKNNRVYHSLKKEGEDYYKYLDGNDVKRYLITWERKEYLKYGKNLAAPRSNFDLYSTPRILVRQIPSKLPYSINACYTEDTILNDRNSMNIIYIKENPKFVLGVLNSKAISFWFAHKFGKLQRGLFPQFKINELAIFPIPIATLSKQQPVIDLVDKILVAKKENPQADTSGLEKEIDRLVYELYGLTEEEVKVVEGK